MTTCSVCLRADATPNATLPHDQPELLNLIETNVPGWQSGNGICTRCLELFQNAHRRRSAYPDIFRGGAYDILPTPLRVGANERFTGRGVTIAFLDSGFYFHPDLTAGQNRIKRYVNIARDAERLSKATPATLQALIEESWEELKQADTSSWHGMMTSVVAAGNGFLSSGFYRGIASAANVVLIKVGTANRIRHRDIQRGLEWVLRHREQYQIRVVNISCAGDYEASYLTDGLSRAAEACVRAGIVVCCAAGNSGHLAEHPIYPPASAPGVITVGGFNDRNTLQFADNDLYQSSYGPTIDGLQKPEIIAPSIWLAAPILPNTPTAAAARLYANLQSASDHELTQLLDLAAHVDADLTAARDLPIYLIRQLVSIKLHDHNVISGHYKHVDGTSFASPIVASVAAQMLEANPRLEPHQVKRILIDTARRLEGLSVERQGWGVVLPGLALARVVQTS